MSGVAGPDAGRPAIPVTVIGGYLGAGKTTLVNALLRQANGLRLAVLVNDFGDLPIDADLIEAQDGNLVSIAGGCVCCSYGSDLVAALMQMHAMTPRVQHVLVETSGVALPGQVASALSLLQAFSLDAVVTVVDAGSVRTHAANSYLADTITRQLADADLVILNKIDLADEASKPGLIAWVKQQAPRARLTFAQSGAVPMGVVIGLALERDGGEIAVGHVHHNDAYVSSAIAVTMVRSAQALATALENPDFGLLRAKGIVAEPDGGVHVVQLAGGRTTVVPAPAQVPRGLIVIGLKSSADLAATARAVRALTHP